MKHSFAKRLLVLMMAALMLLSVSPIGALAEELDGDTPTIETVEPMPEEEPVEAPVEESTEESSEESTEESTEEPAEEPAEESEETAEEPTEETTEAVPLALEGEGEEPAAAGAAGVTVTIRSQMAGAYLHSIQAVSVSSGLAESYGYKMDSVTDGVSALDALVKAHELILGENLDADTLKAMLTVSDAGYITTIFGEETGNCSFAVNQGYPNDGTEASWGGYNGTTVATQKIETGDVVDFFVYQDENAWSDQYTWVSVPESITAGESFDVTVKGASVMMGYLYKDAAEFKAAASAVSGAKLVWINAESGMATEAGATTDSDGKATLTALEAGDYLLAAATGDGDGAYKLVMNPTAITVSEPTTTESVVTNITITLTVNGQILSLPGFEFKPGKKEYNIVIPDTWNFVKFNVETTDAGNGQKLTAYLDGVEKKPAVEIKDGSATKQVMTAGGVNKDKQVIKISVGEEEYTFHATRVAYIGSFQAYLDEGRSKKVDLSPTFIQQASADKIYTVTVPEGDALYLSFSSPTTTKAIYINGEKMEDAKYTLDLTTLTFDEDGYASVPIEVRYTGDKGHQGSSFTLKIHRVNSMATITQQPVDTAVNKGESATLSVDAANDGKGELSYQWYSGSAGMLNDEKPIEGETGKTLTVTPDRAGRKAYMCYVTNTVDGNAYVTKSDRVIVTANLNYITPAEITAFSGGGECLEGEEKCPLKVAYTYVDDLNLIKQTLIWYRNDTDSTTGGEAIHETDFPNGSYEFIPQGEKVGTYYYYCTVTLSDKSGVAESVTTVSDGTLMIVYKPYELSFSGSGTAEAPYLIESLEDLNTVRDLVEHGYSLQNQHFLLTADITLPVDWKPIGKVEGCDASLSLGNLDEETEGSVYSYTGRGTKLLPFSGILDGGGHTITVAEGGLPLLGIVRDATVKNLNIYGTKIASYGLVHNYTVDYGTDGNYNTGCPATITIDNVTLKSGSKTLYAGFIGGYASGANTVTIKNSTVESGVVIGYDPSAARGYSNLPIGSFAGDFNGTVSNCVSYATVQGTDYVGGLVGRKGQSMGSCVVQNSQFFGSVNASGDWVGGIVGSGYYAASAPNTPIVTIRNCLVAGTVIGGDYVGGVYGGEPVCENCWANGSGGVRDNVFYGTLTATGSCKGGIVGFMKSVNEYVTIANNYYLDTCGADQVVGKVEIIDDASYTDARCGEAATAEQMRDGSIVEKLNSSESSSKYWAQGEKHPVISNTPVIYAIEAAGTVEKQHYTGDALDLTGLTLTAKWSDGTTTAIALDDPDLIITGYDAAAQGTQTLTLAYGVAKTEVYISVLKMPEEVLDVEALIGAIGEPEDVTKGSKAAIEAARRAYDALSAEAKALVTNYAKLTAAERKLAALDPAGETKAIGTGDTRLVLDGVTYMVDAEAASLMQTIANLRDAGGTDDEGILSAYRTYDAMSSDLKAQVFNFADLEAMCDALGVRAHRDSLSGFAAEGLPWYVGLEISAITSGADYEIVAGSIGHNALLSLWHIEFINRLTGGRFTPYDSVTLRVAAPEMSEGLEQFRMALYADGRVAYFDCTVSGGELVFAVTEGGVYGFIGGTAAATETLVVEDEPVEEAIAEPEAPEAEAAPETLEPVARPEAESGHTLLWLWIAVGVAGVAALVVVVVLKRQDRKAKHAVK